MKKKLPIILAIIAVIVVAIVYIVNHTGSNADTKINTTESTTSELSTADNGMAVTGVSDVDFWVPQNTDEGLKYTMTVGENKAVIEVKLATDHDAQWYYDQDIATYTANDQLFLEGEARYGDYIYKTINTDVANPRLYTDSPDGTTIIVELNNFVDTSREDVITILASLGTTDVATTEATTAE